MNKDFLPYEEGRLVEFESRGMRCPRCGDFLELIGDIHREIVLCPNCGYYQESHLIGEEIGSSGT